MESEKSIKNFQSEKVPSTATPFLPEGLSTVQISKYISRRDSEIVTLESAFQKREADTIREISHRLKGNAALYAMPEFGLAAGRLLLETDAGNWERMATAFGEMKSELEKARAKFLG